MSGGTGSETEIRETEIRITNASAVAQARDFAGLDATRGHGADHRDEQIAELA